MLSFDIAAHPCAPSSNGQMQRTVDLFSCDFFPIKKYHVGDPPWQAIPCSQMLTRVLFAILMRQSTDFVVSATPVQLTPSKQAVVAIPSLRMFVVNASFFTCLKNQLSHCGLMLRQFLYFE